MKQHLNRRFPCSLLLGLLGIALASCSGGGGSSSSTQPLLLAAAYDGLTITPTEDDHLVLSFTEETTNITGTEIDDAQLTLSNILVTMSKILMLVLLK